MELIGGREIYKILVNEQREIKEGLEKERGAKAEDKNDEGRA